MNGIILPRPLLVAALTLLCGCGTTAAGGQASSAAAAPAAQATAAAAPAAETPPPAFLTTAGSVPACTLSGPASASFPAASSAPATPGIKSAAVAGDTFTLTFPSGTPAFQATPQGTPRFFIQTGTVTLAGSAGVHIVLTGFRGDVQNVTGPLSVTSTGPLLREVRELEDFEGVIGWGAGTSGPSCASVTASGSTLTFHFIPATGKG